MAFYNWGKGNNQTCQSLLDSGSQWTLTLRAPESVAILRQVTGGSQTVKL